MADDYTIRVDAGDLADIIGDRQAARADLETCIRDATEAQAQFQKELDNAHQIYRSLRQRICEALQLPVAVGHLSDDDLVSWVTIARSEAGDIAADPARLPVEPVRLQRGSGDPWTPPARVVPLGEPFAGFPEVSGQDGPPAKQDMDPAWLDTAQQRVGEQLADDGPPIKLDVDVTSLRRFQHMAQEQADREDAEQAAGRDDGPPTESMPPVEQPPEAPADYRIGRVFTRGDTCPGQEDLDLVINRSGDVMRVFTEGTPAGIVLRQDGSDLAWSEQLHMNGTLWEIVHVGEQSSVAEQTPVDDEKPPAKPNLHVATLYTSQQDGGSRWYELSDGWVVCASTLKIAQRDYPDLALRLTAVQDAHRDLRNEGTATS
jgi:hypothetical protein